LSRYVTGIRKGEWIHIQWPQVAFESELIALDPDETKNREGRTIPILKGDMRDLRFAAKQEHHEKRPDSPRLYNREVTKIVDFRGSREKPCIAAGIPDLNFHDLRRTAVRKMRRAGVPQVDTHKDQRS
jgi:integrase